MTHGGLSPTDSESVLETPACARNNSLHISPACSALARGQRKARDLFRRDVSTVIHFSTTTPVHSCTVVDQHVYRSHPQAYAQDASLAGPGAGVI